MERRIQTFEKSYRGMLGVAFREHQTNGHGSAMSADMTRCQKLLKEGGRGWVEGGHYKGRLGKSWKDIIKEWTGQSLSSLLRIANDKGRWVAIATVASVENTQQCLVVTEISYFLW